MNRFRFRFQSVLRFRELIEENRKRDFGVALNHLDREKRELDAIDRIIDDHDDFVENKSTGTISPRDLENRFHYARHLESRREGQTKRIESAGVEADAKRGELVEATKKKKIFERLKERDREAHEAASRKEEQAASDELTSLRRAREMNRKDQ